MRSRRPTVRRSRSTRCVRPHNFRGAARLPGTLRLIGRCHDGLPTHGQPPAMHGLADRGASRTASPRASRGARDAARAAPRDRERFGGHRHWVRQNHGKPRSPVSARNPLRVRGHCGGGIGFLHDQAEGTVGDAHADCQPRDPGVQRGGLHTARGVPLRAVVTVPRLHRARGLFDHAVLGGATPASSSPAASRSCAPTGTSSCSGR